MGRFEFGDMIWVYDDEGGKELYLVLEQTWTRNPESGLVKHIGYKAKDKGGTNWHISLDNKIERYRSVFDMMREKEVENE